MKYARPFVPGRVPCSSGALAVFLPLGRNTFLLLLTVQPSSLFLDRWQIVTQTESFWAGRRNQPHTLSKLFGNSCFTVEQQRVALWRSPSVRAGFLLSERLRCWVNRLKSALEIKTHGATDSDHLSRLFGSERCWPNNYKYIPWAMWLGFSLGKLGHTAFGWRGNSIMTIEMQFVNRTWHSWCGLHFWRAQWEELQIRGQVNRHKPEGQGEIKTDGVVSFLTKITWEEGLLHMQHLP